MIIYLDVYFLKNIIFNFLLLYLTSFIIRRKIKIYRAIISAIVGGLYAILALYFENIFHSVMLKILISITMLYITFGKKEITFMTSSFFVLSYIIAGIIASILKINSQAMLILVAISSIIIFYLYKRNQKYNDYYELHIEFLQTELTLTAKLDTGNELKDNILGEPVIVVSEEKIKNKIENELVKILNNERLEIPERYKNRIRLISFKTISGEGIKIGLKLDKVIIYTETKNIESNAIMILTERNFRNYNTLIGRNLLEGGFEYESNSFTKIKD